MQRRGARSHRLEGRGVVVAAPVRLEAEAFTDPRIQLLADLGGWTRYEALGRLAFLWSACTERQLYYVPEAIVRGCLGMNGADLLCDSDLAERTPEGLRIRGTAGRVEWLGELREKRQRAGRARAECVNRDTLGRMQSNNQPAHAGDLPSTSPAPSSAPTLVPVPVPTQAPDPEAEEKPVRKRTSKAQLPDSWVPDRSESNVAAEAEAKARGVDLRSELSQLRDWAKANHEPKADWNATWRNWIRRARATPKQSQPAQQTQRTDYLMAVARGEIT